MDITNYITICVNTNTPITFVKFGDGEFYCAFGSGGCNCDNDSYTPKLSLSLRESFVYLTENTTNTYIGLWQNSDRNIEPWQNLVSKPIQWANYHSIIIDNKYNYEKVELYKAIKNSKNKKIIICNELLIKSKILLDADDIVIVPFQNWFDTQFDSILQQVIDKMGPNTIVITSCGMSAKVLITELKKRYNNGIYLDFGSAMDLLCTKRDSRGAYSYAYMETLFRELLPPNWNDEKYDYIYEEAKSQLGLHLPK
jgi:hypothetical protein